MNLSIKALCLLTLTLPSILCVAQTDVTYIDKDWKETDKANAVYYRHVAKLAENNYKVEDFYINGKIQMTGYYSSVINVADDTGKNTARNGLFTFYLDNSNTKNSEGNYKDGKHTGAWKEYYDNSTNLRAEYAYVNDELDGNYILYEDTSLTKTLEGEYKAGKRTGKWQEYYKNSNALKAEYSYTENERNGKAIFYDMHTKKMYVKGEYKAGARTGTWKTYYPASGKLSRILEYTTDSKDYSVKNYYEEGALRSEGKYVDNMREGQWKFYDKDGYLTSSEIFKNDSLDGTALIYKKTFNILHYIDIDKQNDGYVYGNIATNKLWQERNYKDGLPEGIWKTYDERSGALMSLTTYKNGKRNGQYIQNQNGQLIESGEYTDDLKSGEWRQYYPEGLIKTLKHYEGDKKNGVSISYTPEGKKKNEEIFVEGKREGVSSYYYERSDTLKARVTYKNDTQSGLAVYYFPNGRLKAEGELFENTRHGKWKFYYEDGTRVHYIEYFSNKGNDYNIAEYDSISGKRLNDCSYVNRKKDGLFTFYSDSSETPIAFETYKEDSLDGPAVRYYSDGKIEYEGSYARGVKKGAWKYYYKNGHTSFIRYFTNNGNHCICTGYDSATGRQLNEESYIDGKKDGASKYFYPDADSPGRVKSEGSYALGNMSGQWHFYYPNGKLRSIENYILGEKNGEATYYDSLTNSIKDKGRYFNDSMQGEWESYYPGTQKKAELRNYSGNVLNGVMTVYDINGHILCTGNWINDKKVGDWQYYYGDGKEKNVWISVHYRNDVPDGANSVYYQSGKKMIAREFEDGHQKSEQYFDEAGLPLQEPDLKMRLAIDKRENEVKKIIEAFSGH